jgi:hypothetical protein
MREMYQNRMLNTVILAFSGIAMIVFFVLIRQQTAISDEQFLQRPIHPRKTHCELHARAGVLSG